MASKYTDEELTKVGRKAIQQIPYAIRRGLGDESDIEFKNRPGNGRSIADVLPGRRVVYVDKPNEFVANPRQLTAHEMTHMLQSRLHPSVQSRFPATDSKDPYGEMNSPNAGQVLQQARSKGKTISDFSREEQGAIVQRYTALQQGLEDAQKNNSLTPDARDRYQQSLKVYQPFIDDYAKLPMAAMEPTDPDQKGINTKPQAPPGPDPGLLHATEVMPTDPPERIPVPDVPFQDPGPDPSQQGPVSATPPPQTGPQVMGGQIPQQAPPQNPNVVNQQQAPSPQQQDLAHSTALGHGFKSIMNLLGGTRTEYQQTPNGPVPVQKQNNATDFFKNIIAGALVGGAAGGQGTSGSGWQAAARGAGAVQQQNQQRQQQAQAQAQQQFQNQQEVSKESRERMLTDAQIQNFHSESAARQAQSDLLNQEYHDKHNAASQSLLDHMKAAGGVDPIDGSVPAELPASQLMVDYTKNPKIRQAPTGYHRVFVDKSDASELTWNGVHWEHPDGTPANVTDKTTVRVMDVPEDVMNKKIPASGVDINKAAGMDLVDPKGSFPLSPTDMINLRAKGLAESRQNAQIDLDKKRVGVEASRAATEAARLNHEITTENRAAFSGADKEITTRIKSLQDSIKDPTISPDIKSHTQAQIEKATKELKSIREKIYPNTKVDLGDVQDVPVAHPEVLTALQSLPNYDPETARSLANMTTDQIVPLLQQSQMPQANKDKIMAALRIKPTAEKKGWKPEDVGKAVGQVISSAPRQILSGLTNGAVSSVPPTQ